MGNNNSFILLIKEMKNIALIALLGVTQASESTTNTKAVAANTNAQMA